MKRIVALVGGHILADTAGFRTSTYTPADLANPYGIFGDNLRGEASAVLYRAAPERTQVVVLGGVTPLHKEMPDAPHLSAVIKEEMIAAGVPAWAITEIDMDPVCGTFRQLTELAKFLAQTRRVEDVLIVSNDWQLPRIKAMIVFRDELMLLRSHEPRTRCVAAEDVLVGTNPERWYDEICAAYNTPAVRATIAKELNGAKMIADGTYQFPTTQPAR